VTVRDVKNALKNLSQGTDALNEAYAEAVKRIDGQMKGHRIIADEVLSCIIHAHRPITVNELRYVMALTPGETKIDPDALPEEEDLTAFCAGLVQIDPESQTIRMVHYTAHEYFSEIRHIRYPDAHKILAGKCLTQIRRTAPSPTSGKQ
jgi:hypothetical protein